MEKGYPHPTDDQQLQQSYPHLQPPPAYDQQYGQPVGQPYAMPMPQMPQQPIINDYHHQPQTITQIITAAPVVGPEPTGLVCPSCHQHTVTRVDHEASGKTHIMALILCCFICWPCAWMPYAMDSCRNANHYCSNCGAFIGTYS